MPPVHRFTRTLPLLSSVDWRAIRTRTAKELSNRELHAPVVSTYRWWARRPHNVMGALLDAAVAHYGLGLTVSDPFSGGGTVTFEAAKRGLKVYAQDLYPWPTRGLVSALGTCEAPDLQKAADRLLVALEPHRAAYRTMSGAELSHVLRVRVSTCLHCTKHVYEYPHYLVSVTSRGKEDDGAFFGCRSCGSVSLRTRKIKSFTCDCCGHRWNLKREPSGCPHCFCNVLCPQAWSAVLVQELAIRQGQLRAILRPKAEGDPIDFELASEEHPALAVSISEGKETKRLLGNGFRTWGDLYTHRQARVLVDGLKTIVEMDCNKAIKDRLAFSLLGAAEMPAFLSRWDRFHLKAFEGMANHRYAHTKFVVESNLLSPVGRGTLPHRLASATNALEWLIESRETPPKIVATVPGLPGRKRTDWDVLVTTGSSVKQALQTASVNVVVTDPPYFDDVQYGELARLFHVWLSVYDPTVVVDEHSEAVPNATRGTSSADYEATIASCLTESRRTLKAGGRLILTFHNKKIAAWQALAGAISTAGLRVVALAAVLAENRADHCKRNVKAMLHDLVIECAPANIRRLPKVSLEFIPKSAAEKNLAAIGLALANCVAIKDSARIAVEYNTILDSLCARKRLIE